MVIKFFQPDFKVLFGCEKSLFERFWSKRGLLRGMWHMWNVVIFGVGTERS